MTVIEKVLIAAAFGLVVVLWFTLYPRPRLQITDRGFFDRDLHLGWIPWDEIEGAYPPNLRHGDAVRLRLRPGDRLIRRLKRLRRAEASDDGTYEVHIDLREADISPVEMLQEVVARSQGGANRVGPLDPSLSK